MIKKNCNAPLSFIGQHYTYRERLPMTTWASERLLTQPYDKQMPAMKWQINVIEVSLATFTIDEDGIPNTGSIDQATLVSSAKLAAWKVLYTTDKPVDRWHNRIY